MQGGEKGGARGTSTWNRHLEPSPGTFIWNLHLEPSPGTFNWNLHLEPSPGTSWSHHLGPSPGNPAGPSACCQVHRSAGWSVVVLVCLWLCGLAHRLAGWLSWFITPLAGPSLRWLVHRSAGWSIVLPAGSINLLAGPSPWWLVRSISSIALLSGASLCGQAYFCNSYRSRSSFL